MTTKSKVSSMLVALMIMAIAMPAVTANNIDVTAQVSNGGSIIAPGIECMFVLSDDGDVSHVTEGTQILPNLGNGADPVPTDFTKYVIVSHEYGIAHIATVYEKLFGPNGALIGAENECTDITDQAEQFDALEEALNSNLITATEYADLLYMLNTDKSQARMFMIENTLYNCDMPGEYSVYFKAVDNYGVITEATTPFDYLSTTGLNLDFSGVTYGPILINSQKWISGDMTYGGDKPTVINVGNTPIQVSISASDLIGVEDPVQTISVDALEVELLGTTTGLENSMQTLPGELQPCTPTQISFSILAPLGTSSNSYTGSLTINMETIPVSAVQ